MAINLISELYFSKQVRPIQLYVNYIKGIKSINYSADVSVGKDEKIGFFSILLSFILAIVFAIVLFKLIPLAITSFLDRMLHVNNILFNVIDGVLKISIFILYVYLISLMKDIYRVFEYHGAEHKSIFFKEKSVEAVFVVGLSIKRYN